MPPVDYADWLTPARLVVEEAQWAAARTCERYAAGVRRLVQEQGVRTVTEFGCGTGLIPPLLADLVTDRKLEYYAMVDRNPGCLAAARQRNSAFPWCRVVDMELRDLQPRTELVCGFSVLKHLRLAEWEQVFVKLFALARFGLFTVTLADRAHEDSGEYTHTWVTEEILANVLRRVGHYELWRDSTTPEEPMIATTALRSRAK